MKRRRHIKMQTLSIDIETYSSTDIKKSGVYKYVEAPDFTILLFAYSYDNTPVYVVELASGEPIPQIILDALIDPSIKKTAHNANFERTCIAKYLNISLSPEQWECTMVKCAMVGLPMKLDEVAKVLQIEDQKDTAGTALINYFSKPCKPTKTNGQRTRNLPEHSEEKWQAFVNYNRQDVVVEKAIREKISWFKIPDTEVRLWQLDQRINDGGVLLDPTLVAGAQFISDEYNAILTKKAVELTNLNNPNSAAQLKEWLSVTIGEEVTSLTKTAVPELISKTDDETVLQVLGIRQEMAKTSVKKYTAMQNYACLDSRVRGLLQFCGAGRTWRWAGRGVQVQNLPQNHLQDLELARDIVINKDTEFLAMLYGNVPDTLSQLIRTSFIAKPGHRLLVSDFKAIEARVIAWLAGERWRLDVFNTHGKIYEASASQMFKVPIELITKGNPLRQKGKVSELALGYQGGPNALISMGALTMGIPEEELPKLVAMWRNANKKIVKLWYDVEEAAISAVQGEPSTIQHNIHFSMIGNVLAIRLPSGRCLYYQNPRLKPNRFGGESIVYDGMNQTTKKWMDIDTYGGKLVENLTQAIARDCLADAMLRADDAGYKIIMSVHDEIVCEMPEYVGSIEELNELMGATISWAKGLPLGADGYETKFYKKDD